MTAARSAKDPSTLIPRAEDIFTLLKNDKPHPDSVSFNIDPGFRARNACCGPR
jgi:hypothetical protein